MRKTKRRLSQPKVMKFSKSELEFLNLCAEIIVEIVLDDDTPSRKDVGNKPIPHAKRKLFKE